jgi:hypothetical protein
MKNDAATLQSDEAIMGGTGETDKGGIAAQAQSMADKRV